MYKEELLEGLDDLLGGNDVYLIKTKADGTLVIHTKLVETEEGRIINKEEDVDDDEDEEFSSEELNIF